MFLGTLRTSAVDTKCINRLKHFVDPHVDIGYEVRGREECVLLLGN